MPLNLRYTFDIVLGNIGLPWEGTVGFRFRKRIKIAKGVYINVGKSGVASMSAKAGPLTINQSLQSGKTRMTASGTGTGLSYTKMFGGKTAGPRNTWPSQPAVTNPVLPVSTGTTAPTRSPSRGSLWWVGGGFGFLGVFLTENVGVGLLVSAAAVAVTIAFSQRK